MKIDPSLKSGQTGEVRADARVPKGARAPDPGDAASVEVQLSPAAAHLQALSHEIAASPDVFDARKVAEIRQAITNGQLQIDPEAIADSLIAAARALLDATRA